MIRPPGELYPELTLSTGFGDSPVETTLDLIEPRDGCIIPTPDVSRIEYGRLMRLSRHLAQRATIPALYDLRIPTPEQLQRITLDPETGCWELPVYQDPRGRARYGKMQVKGIDVPSSMAHRTMYQVFFGTDSLPGGRADNLDHICENKPCCYPRHLEKVTSAENTRRGRMRTHGMEPLF